MKRLLLDTHVLLWWLSDDPQLGESSKQAIANPKNCQSHSSMVIRPDHYLNFIETHLIEC